MWSLVAGWLCVAQASEFSTSTIDPMTLVAQHSPSVDDKKLVREMLDRYARASNRVLVGEIVNTRSTEENGGNDRVADVQVEYWVRGEGIEFITVTIPYNAPFIPGDADTVPGKAVLGYRVMIFIDSNDRVLNGNAIFYMDDKFLWRNKRPQLFLNPRFDREWASKNPYLDYIIIPRDEVETALLRTQQAFWMRFR